MGGAMSTVLGSLKDTDDKNQQMAKENLQQCAETAQIIAQNFRLQVQEVYKNPDEYKKWQVVGGRQDREATFIGVTTSEKPSSHIKDGVDDLVAGIFDAIEDKPSMDTFKAGISNLITGVFNTFLGSASAGASTESKFLIVPHGFALYRVDIYMYKYTFSSEGFKDHYESQTVVYASRGILESKNLTPDELVAYVSSMMEGDAGKIKKWLSDFNEMRSGVQSVDT